MTKEGLPPQFLEDMRELLGEEFEAYLDSFRQPKSAGLRLNSGKLTGEEWEKLAPFPTEPVLWAENGRYYEEGLQPARDPYYYAGLYYIQEPSAMAPAALLPVEPGDRVLDVCAAPGGKSTELGARLKGQGLLFSNDISSSRAKALLKNLELSGVPGICVSSEAPERLAELLPGFFDKILVDAPCSGEGMFRRDERMVKDWESRGPAYYGPIQRQILRAAAEMLRPGGVMVYSTCTFSRYEDEEAVLDLLAQCPELELDPIPLFPGAVSGFGLDGCVRLFPHKLRGEGHFVARLRKKAGEERRRQSQRRKPAALSLGPDSAALLDALLSALSRSLALLAGNAVSGKTGAETLKEGLRERNGSLYLLPEEFPEELCLRFLRTGLLVGEVKKGRFEPSQPLAMALSAKAVESESGPVSLLSMSRLDGRVIRYLKGETIALEPEEPDRKGWILVCVDGFPLGWGKGNGRTVKNKYYPGWRWQ